MCALCRCVISGAPFALDEEVGPVPCVPMGRSEALTLAPGHGVDSHVGATRAMRCMYARMALCLHAVPTNTRVTGRWRTEGLVGERVEVAGAGSTRPSEGWRLVCRAAFDEHLRYVVHWTLLNHAAFMPFSISLAFFSLFFSLSLSRSPSLSVSVSGGHNSHT